MNERVFLEPIKVTEEDLADCADVAQLKGRKAVDITPWAVDTVEKYNECAAGKKELADKVREHNKKSKNESSRKAGS